MKLSGAIILISRDIKFLQTAPAAYSYHWAIMTAADTINKIRQLVENYNSHRYLYLHRQIMIVNCTEWSFSDTYVQTDVKLERVLIGDPPSRDYWQFGVRWDDVNPNNLAINRLSGSQIRDTIVFNFALLKEAELIKDGKEGQLDFTFFRAH